MIEEARPRIIEVFVVVPPRLLLLDVAGPVEVLRKANLEQQDVRYRVRYVGPSPALCTSVGLDVSGIAPLPEVLPEAAVVVVPGSTDVPLPRAASNDPGEGPELILEIAAQEARCETEIADWLVRIVRPGIRLVTICSGAILAGRAGLLDGHDCTTHHASVQKLRTSAPAARVLENRLYVEDRERLTSAGITAGIDLMLAMVAREVGHGVALAVARYLVVYMRRGGADPQLSPWLEGRNHIHPAIHKIQDAVAADPARDWQVASMADLAAMSPRSLSRLFNQQTGLSVTDYVNRMRIALAHDLVSGSRLDMENIAEKAGFGSTRQFRRAWNRLHKLPPSRLRTDLDKAGMD